MTVLCVHHVLCTPCLKKLSQNIFQYNFNKIGKHIRLSKPIEVIDNDPPRLIIFEHYHEQEAPLTLRGQRGRCRNIKREPPKYLEPSIAQGHAHPFFLHVIL